MINSRLLRYRVLPSRKSICLLIALICEVYSLVSFGDSLTWDQCLHEAYLNNTDLRSAQASVSKAQASLSGSLSGFLPQVGASAGYTRTNASIVSIPGASSGSINSSGPGGASGMPSSNGTDLYSTSLTVSQNIFNGFQDSAAREQNKYNLDSSKQSKGSTSAQVRHDLRVAFETLIYDQELLELEKDIVKRRKENQELVQLRFEGGTENKGNYLKSLAAYHSAQVDERRATRNVRVASENLARLLGRSGAEPLEVQGKLDVQVKPSLDPKDTPNFEQLVLATPAHLGADADVKASDAAITKARGGYYPTLALNGSYSLTGTSLPLNSSQWSAGVTLSIPIFSGFSTVYSVATSVSDRDRTEAVRSSTDRQTLVNLKQAYADYVFAIEQKEAQQETMDAAKIRSQIARSKYANGLQSFEDWDIIESDLISQQQILLSDELQAASSEASWDQNRGLGIAP